MDSIDTAIGGGDSRFRTTHWSLILAAGDPAHPRHREQWAELASRYWKPVYTYIRIAWRKSNEDAKDLAQDFFVYLLDKDYLSRMRPQRGSFRAYLRRALGHFLVDAERYRKARAPREPVVRIDADAGLLDRLLPDSPDASPEEAFDRAWSRSLLQDCIDQLKKELTERGKGLHWEIFRRYCLPPEGAPDPGRTTGTADSSPDAPTYEALGASLGVGKSDVRTHLAYARGELQRILRSRIREYVDSEEEAEREFREVLRG